MSYNDLIKYSIIIIFIIIAITISKYNSNLVSLFTDAYRYLVKNNINYPLYDCCKIELELKSLFETILNDINISELFYIDYENEEFCSIFLIEYMLDYRIGIIDGCDYVEYTSFLNILIDSFKDQFINLLNSDWLIDLGFEGDDLKELVVLKLLDTFGVQCTYRHIEGINESNCTSKIWDKIKSFNPE